MQYYIYIYIYIKLDMIHFMNETIKIKWVSYCITVMRIPVGKSVNAKKKRPSFI